VGVSGSRAVLYVGLYVGGQQAHGGECQAPIRHGRTLGAARAVPASPAKSCRRDLRRQPRWIAVSCGHQAGDASPIADDDCQLAGAAEEGSRRATVIGDCFPFTSRCGRRMVSQTFARWNLIGGWLARLDGLRHAA